MRNILKKVFILIYSCSFVSCIYAALPFSAYAADTSPKNVIPKGITITVMIVVFIAAAALSGYISYKLKKAAIRKGNKNNSDNDTE